MLEKFGFGSLPHAEVDGLVESHGIDLLQNRLESDQRLLKNLVPVRVSQFVNDWHKHGECLVLVCLQNVKEVVVFKEAHRSVSNLQMISTNRFDDALEETRNQVLDFFDFAHLENLLQLRQEECFLDAVGEGPVFEQTF